MHLSLADSDLNANGLWPFQSPGIRLPLENIRGDVVRLYKGDRATDYSTQLEFSLLMDRRVRVVEVMFWRLVRESDGVGPDVDRDVIASWFGEQNIRETGREFGGVGGNRYWGVHLEDYPFPSQIIDPVFAQCHIDGRVQFRLASVQDVPVDDYIVDNFFLAEDGSCPGDLFGFGAARSYVSQFENQGLVATPQRGQLSVFLSRGAWRDLGINGQCMSQQVASQWGGEYIALAEDRLSEVSNEPGGRYVLAHEIGHALDLVHCADCQGNLMASGVEIGGDSLTDRQCQDIGESE